MSRGVSGGPRTLSILFDDDDSDVHAKKLMVRPNVRPGLPQLARSPGAGGVLV